MAGEYDYMPGSGPFGSWLNGMNPQMAQFISLAMMVLGGGGGMNAQLGFSVPFGSPYDMGDQMMRQSMMTEQWNLRKSMQLQDAATMQTQGNMFIPGMGDMLGGAWRSSPTVPFFAQQSPGLIKFLTGGMGLKEGMSQYLYQADQYLGPIGGVAEAGQVSAFTNAIERKFFPEGKNRNPFYTSQGALSRDETGQLVLELSHKGMLSGGSAIDPDKAVAALESLAPLFNAVAKMTGSTALPELVRSLQLLSGGRAGAMSPAETQHLASTLGAWTMMGGLSGEAMNQVLLSTVNTGLAMGQTDMTLSADIGMTIPAKVRQYLQSSAGLGRSALSDTQASRVFSALGERAAKSGLGATYTMAKYWASMGQASSTVTDWIADTESDDPARQAAAWSMEHDRKIDHTLGMEMGAGYHLTRANEELMGHLSTQYGSPQRVMGLQWVGALIPQLKRAQTAEMRQALESVHGGRFSSGSKGLAEKAASTLEMWEMLGRGEGVENEAQWLLTYGGAGGILSKNLGLTTGTQLTNFYMDWRSQAENGTFQATMRQARGAERLQRDSQIFAGITDDLTAAMKVIAPLSTHGLSERLFEYVTSKDTAGSRLIPAVLGGVLSTQTDAARKAAQTFTSQLLMRADKLTDPLLQRQILERGLQLGTSMEDITLLHDPQRDIDDTIKARLRTLPAGPKTEALDGGSKGSEISKESLTSDIQHLIAKITELVNALTRGPVDGSRQATATTDHSNKNMHLLFP